MADAELQSDEFQTLLTDALRAGPGSPEWHQAVRILRASNQNVDEYTLLYSAREHLESGKSFRVVRPGPGFTKKVFDGLEEQGGTKSRSLPTATVVAVIALLVIVAVAAVVTFVATRGGSAQDHAIDELNNLVLSNKAVTPFTSAVIPPAWIKIGEVPLVVNNGQLQPAPAPATAATTATAATNASTGEYKVGGIVGAGSLSGSDAFELDVTLRVNRPTDDGIVQIFVSDSPIDDAHLMGTHELVWLLQGGQAKVFLPTGRSEGTSEKIQGFRDLPVKLLLNKELVIVEAGGKRLYAGPHLLPASQPRYVGVRFLRKNGEKWEHLGVTSITLAKQ